MQAYGSADLAAAFRTVRKNTVQIAEDIPENKYDFVAAPGARSVRELLAHIATSPMIQDDMHRVRKITTFKGYDFGAIGARAAGEADKLKTKSAIVAALKSEGETFAKWLESLRPDFLAERMTDMTGAPSRTRFESQMSVKEHEMHHRGQLMLVERILGIVPHLTRAREETLRQRQAAAAAR
jgi:uncharacterized damage-inducible protein DinB